MSTIPDDSSDSGNHTGPGNDPENVAKSSAPGGALNHLIDLPPGVFSYMETLAKSAQLPASI